jgi:hypothetical protein
MGNLLEYVGNVHIIFGPYRGNPISLYLSRNGNSCQISPRVYPWNEVVGEGDSPNRAAADFEEKWKAKGLAPEMFTGPHWDGIKPEKPTPPKPAAKPAEAKAPEGKPAEPKTAIAAGPKPETGTPAEAASNPAPLPPSGQRDLKPDQPAPKPEGNAMAGSPASLKHPSPSANDSEATPKSPAPPASDSGQSDSSS